VYDVITDSCTVGSLQHVENAMSAQVGLPLSATEDLLSQDLVCGTIYRLL